MCVLLRVFDQKSSEFIRFNMTISSNTCGSSSVIGWACWYTWSGSARGHHHDDSRFPLDYPGLRAVIFIHTQIVTNRLNSPPPEGWLVAFAVDVRCAGLPTRMLPARRSVKKCWDRVEWKLPVFVAPCTKTTLWLVCWYSRNILLSRVRNIGYPPPPPLDSKTALNGLFCPT